MKVFKWWHYPSLFYHFLFCTKTFMRKRCGMRLIFWQAISTSFSFQNIMRLYCCKTVLSLAKTFPKTLMVSFKLCMQFNECLKTYNKPAPDLSYHICFILTFLTFLCFMHSFSWQIANLKMHRINII